MHFVVLKYSSSYYFPWRVCHFHFLSFIVSNYNIHMPPQRNKSSWCILNGNNLQTFPVLTFPILSFYSGKENLSTYSNF